MKPSCNKGQLSKARAITLTLTCSRLLSEKCERETGRRGRRGRERERAREEEERGRESVRGGEEGERVLEEGERGREC